MDTNMAASMSVSYGESTLWPANGLSGLSYDASNNSLWATNSSFTGTSEVVDFSTLGEQLSEFSTGSFEPYGGIAYVPASVPEASTATLLLLGVLAVSAFAKIDARSQSGTVPLKSIGNSANIEQIPD